MKKILLLISCLIISVTSTFAAGLNAYAFGAGYIYDANTNKLHISWSQQAKAARVTIVALDGDNRYVLAEYKNLGAVRHEYVIDLWDAIAAGMPTNTNLEVAIEVRTADETPNKTKHEFVKKIDFQWPFSIDIDRNPYSKYFGLMYVGQMNGSKDRGVYVLDQQGGAASSVQIDEDINKSFSSQNWFTYTHAVPFMVRTLQDGTGRLLISSSDRSQNTHLWLATPQTGDAVPVYSEWTNVITSTQLKSWTGHSVSTDKFANAGLDIRENGDCWDILLYMATVNSNTENHDAGNAYSGMYRVAKSSTDLTGGTYTPYTAPTPDSSYPSGFKPHSVISNAYTASMLNASANFDKFGGVLYNATSENDNQEESAFIHKTLGGKFKSDYKDETYLQRNKARTKGARFSPDFSKLAIAQGRMADEMRIYDVTQADGNSHIVLSNGQSVNIITSTSGTTYADRVFAHDIAWDYAKNVYVSVRNEGSKYGIYAVATDLNGAPITTPIDGTPLNVNCPDGEFTISLSSNINAGATLTGAGTYASCTPVTVTATPDGSHKFLRWSEGGVEVSTTPSYTFYATRDRDLVAEFEYAVYNVEWYNLFQSDQDITEYIINLNSAMDGKTNSRLWRLFQVAFNEALKEKYPSGTLRSDQQNISPNGITHYQVATFIAGSNANAILLDFIGLTNTKGLSKRPFKWLAPYIKDALKRQGITSTSTDLTYWKATLYRFFNRSNKAYTLTNGNVVDYDFGEGDFTEYGKPTYWRIWWADIACGLEPQMRYGDPMPTIWDQSYTPTTYIQEAGNPTNHLTPGKWYKWNPKAEDANKLLAWRYGDPTKVPSAQTEKTIVRNVYKDGALFATWVDKSISEDEDKQQKNSDVIYLLNHHNGTHNIEVDRTLQANMYNTFCLPFGVNAKSQLPSELQDATFVKFDRVDKLYDNSGDEVAVLNFSEVTFSGADTLEAGKPYLVLPKTDISTSKVFTNIKTDYKNGDKNNPTVVERAKTVTQETANGGHVSFCGTINSVSIPEQTVILVADSRLAKTTETGNMLGLRGYFIVDDPYIQSLADEGKLYLSMKKPVTTSIPVAPEAEQQTKPEVRKVMYDGQIYILRGDEVYTITGHRVK